MRTAFLVEDDAAIRSVLTEALEELVEVKVVGWSGTEQGAIHWLELNPGAADMVVLDLFLDSGSGLGVLSRFQQLAPAPRVIVLSNGATSLLRRSCMLLGAEAVYDKASDLDAFYAHCGAVPGREAAAGQPAH